MVAPLYDNRGTVRYFVGAQVDISGLIEDGRGLDSFARYLDEKSLRRQRDNDQAQESGSKKSMRVLNEFGQMLSLDEFGVFQSRSRSSSIQDNASGTNHSSRGPPKRRETGIRQARRVLGNEERNEEEDRNSWAFSSIGPSGKLPGVYQNVRLFLPHSMSSQAYRVMKTISTSLSALILPSESSSFPPVSAFLASYNRVSSPASGVRHMFAMVSPTPLRLEPRSLLRSFGFHKAVARPIMTPPLSTALTVTVTIPTSPPVP